MVAGLDGHFRLVPGKEVTILCNIDPVGRSERVNGSEGGNTYSAGIMDAFVLPPITSTFGRSDAPAGVMEQESGYFDALGTANGVFWEVDNLRVTAPRGKLISNNTGPSAEQPLLPTPIAKVTLPSPINVLTEGQVNQAIKFDGSLSSSDVEITCFSWRFGDGATMEEAVVEHSFAATGSYAGFLTVTDVNSQSAETSMVITIQ